MEFSQQLFSHEMLSTYDLIHFLNSISEEAIYSHSPPLTPFKNKSPVSIQLSIVNTNIKSPCQRRGLCQARIPAVSQYRERTKTAEQMTPVSYFWNILINFSKDKQPSFRAGSRKLSITMPKHSLTAELCEEGICTAAGSALALGAEVNVRLHTYLPQSRRDGRDEGCWKLEVLCRSRRRKGR